MKIVVLGANSFSGQDFIDLLLDNDQYSVIGISRSPEKPPMYLRHSHLKNLSRYQFHQLDFNVQMDDVLSLLDVECPDYIVNFAAQSEVAPSWDFPEHWYQTNCVALGRLVNYLRKQTYLQRYLHISSPEVYGSCDGEVTEISPCRPSTPYAASKAAADCLLDVYAKQYHFPLLTVRSTNVYGARQQLYKIIPRTIINFSKEQSIELHGGGHAVKSYIHIRDVSRGELAVLERGTIGEIYHLSPRSGIAVRDVVHKISQRLGIDFHNHVREVEERTGQDATYIIDSSKAQETLQWSPQISFEDGLDEVVDWIQEHWSTIAQQQLNYCHHA